MEYVQYSVKELASMDYSNNDDDTISIYDLIMFYKNNYNKLGHEEASFKVNIINTEGILLIESDLLSVYFKARNDIGTIRISLDEEGNFIYALEANDKYLNWSLKEREQSLLKRLYVKINKCPISIREELVTYRQESLIQSEKSNDLSNRLKLLKKRNLERRKLL